jgi:hypothetical protein
MSDPDEWPKSWGAIDPPTISQADPPSGRSDHSSLSRSDWGFIDMANQYKDVRDRIADYHACPVDARELLRFSILAYNLMLAIRRRRPDLDIRPLATLSHLHPTSMPNDGELVVLIDDALDVIGETVEALTTGRIGAYIAVTNPRLRLDDENKLIRDALTPNDWKLIRAMADMGAINKIRAIQRKKVVSHVGISHYKSNHNTKSFERLINLKIIRSTPRVGTWLTKLGIDLTKPN